MDLRNWLPAEERPALDRAIKACRQEGVTCASWPTARVGKVFASFIDGSGAHSILVIVPEGRKHAVAALLAKLGAGIRDAWVKHETTDAELREILGQFSAEAVIMPSTLDYVTAAARYFLAMNVAAQTMPPFGLIDFAETVGLTSLNPEAMSVERLLDTLSREIDSERLSSTGIADALANSARWSDEQPMLETWFEDTAEVRQLLAKRLPKTKLRKALLSELLQERRQTMGRVARLVSLCQEASARWRRLGGNGRSRPRAAWRPATGRHPIDAHHRRQNPRGSSRAKRIASFVPLCASSWL